MDKYSTIKYAIALNVNMYCYSDKLLVHYVGALNTIPNPIHLSNLIRLYKMQIVYLQSYIAILISTFNNIRNYILAM